MPEIIIAIDGPAASGKGTLARQIAEILDLAYLDTGSLFRTLAVKVMASGGACTDAPRVLAVLEGLTAAVLAAGASDPQIRTAMAGRGASEVAAIPAVRDRLAAIERDFARNPPPLPSGQAARGAVLDGRDIGTVILPDAPAKLYITASAEARAVRRRADLVRAGGSASYSEVLADIRARDARDMEREAAPLKPASDAAIIDSTNLTADEVLKAAMEELAGRGLIG
ncbi:cytidylate kinase [Alphaproteobacteria bacterium]|nr:cytidylate kinase [Alphaproteobacteria bacterium]